MVKDFTKFYYRKLSDDKKKVYMKLYEAITAQRSEIRISKLFPEITTDEMFEIMSNLYYDAPWLYYWDRTKLIYTETLTERIFRLHYHYNYQAIKKLNAQLEQQINEFQAKYITSDMSNYQKEQAIHDYLVSTVRYAHDDMEAKDNHNILGPFLHKKAVCSGISQAFKMLCDICKIRCMIVFGDTVPKQEVGHAWNIVRLDGENFHVDVTWDIKEKGDITFCYDYFNVADGLVALGHDWDRNLYPGCSSRKYNYYYVNNLYVKTADELSRYIADKLKKKEKYIPVKFASKMLPKAEIERAIEKGFSMALTYTKYYIYISERTHNIYIELV